MSIYRERLQKVQHEMREKQIDLLVLPPSPYMFYVTGVPEQPYFAFLKGPGDWLNGVLIGAEKDPIFVVNWEVHRVLLRSTGIPSDLIGETRVLCHEGDPMVLLEAALDEFDLRHRRVALADRTWACFAEAIRDLLPEAEIVMASDFMDDLLAIKDEHALRLLRRAAEITDAAYAETLKSLRFGVTEKEIALEVDHQFRKFGADGNSFQTSVVFTRPEDAPPTLGAGLQPGDSVIFDIGAVYGGYCSDFGRSVFAGDPPPEYLEMHDLVLQAQTEGMSAMESGQTICEEMVRIVQRVLVDHGFGNYLIPAVGHGIGITVHELPLLFIGDKTLIQPGMTFTIEPTIRIPGQFSNRVEDVVMVGEKGATYLTNHPRDLYIVNE